MEPWSVCRVLRCGCGCLPPLIIIIKYNLAEGGWGELSDPPPRLPGSTGRRPCVVSCSILFCLPLSQSRGHPASRTPGDQPGANSHPLTDSLGVDFRPQVRCRKTCRGRMRSQCLPGKRMWFWPQRAVVVHCSTDRSAFSPAGALGCWFSGPVLSSDSPHCPALLSRHPSDPPEEAPTTPHIVTF